MSKDQFPEDMPLEIGTRLQMRDQQGRILHARIKTVASESVELDFNHPLAGKELNFSITISKLRAATEEELAHGHAHDGHAH